MLSFYIRSMYLTSYWHHISNKCANLSMMCWHLQCFTQNTRWIHRTNKIHDRNELHTFQMRMLFYILYILQDLLFSLKHHVYCILTYVLDSSRACDQEDLSRNRGFTNFLGKTPTMFMLIFINGMTCAPSRLVHVHPGHSHRLSKYRPVSYNVSLSRIFM